MTAPRAALFGYVLSLFTRTAGTLLLPALLARAADAALTSHSTSGPVWLLAGCLALLGVADVGASLTASYAITLGTARRRVALVRHLLGVGARSRLGAGDAVARVVHAASDAASAPVAAASGIVTVSGSLVAIVAIWLLDWRCGLAFTATAPLTLLATRGPLRRLSADQSTYLAAQSDVAGRLFAALAGSRTIRAAGTAEPEIARVLQPLGGLSAAGFRLWNAQRTLTFRVRLALAVVQIATLSVAGLAVGSGRLSPGDLVAVVGFVSLALSGVDQIDTVLGLVMSAASRRRVGAALQLPLLRTGDAVVPAGPVSVTWHGVSIGDGLSGLDLHLPAGASLAVVGASGSGKSLLAASVAGLVQPDSGRVLLNGVALDCLDPEVLHRTVGIAFDAPVLLGTTIADSICYPRAADDVRSREAARLARADGFLQRLPSGYRTKLAAAPMSGGELQRLGLARVFDADAPVLVFDDATSGLDAMTEAEIRDVITSALPGRTRLLAVHHAETAARCDRVAWLDHGRLRAHARHDELWQDPDYRALFGAEVPADEVLA